MAILLFSALPLLGMQGASAHVRYVLDKEEVAEAEGQLPPELIGQVDSLGLALLGITLLIVTIQFLGLYLSKKPLLTRVEKALTSLSDYVPLLLRLLVGIFLISSGLAGRLLTPEFGLELGGLSRAVSSVEIVAGLLLIVGFLTKVAAFLLASLLGTAFLVFGLHGLGHLELLGIAAVIFFEGGVRYAVDAFTIARITALRRVGEYLLRFKTLAMPTLRLTLGMSLVWLGLTEKLLAPQLTIAAIKKYNVPFFPELTLFVFLFGMLEIIIGVHYLLGIFLRIISVVYLMLLTISLFIFGESVIAHLSLFSLVFAFLIRGAGPWRMDLLLRTRP